MKKKNILGLSLIIIYVAFSVFCILKLNTKINNLYETNLLYHESLEEQLSVLNTSTSESVDWVVIDNAEGGKTIISSTQESDGGQYVFEQLPWPTTWGGFAYALKTPDGQLIIFDGGL